MCKGSFILLLNRVTPYAISTFVADCLSFKFSDKLVENIVHYSPGTEKFLQ